MSSPDNSERPVEMLPSGTTLGSYRIERCVGAGGMAVVYEAFHLALNKPVAIKTLNAQYALDQTVKVRFLREGRAAATLHHPNVVDVFDVGEHQEIPYLVMELLRGEDLSKLLARVGKLEPTLAVDLLIPAISALVAAHERNIVHRDLKPENIFLARGKKGVLIPKVLDFGISKLIDAPQVEALTQTHAFLGTPYYMSPEQIRGARDIDGRSDQFSLGVVLYECLMGNKPFVADTMYALLRAIVEYDPPPISALVPAISADLSQVIARALAKDPAHRYASTRELGAALLPFASPRVRQDHEEDFGVASSSDQVGSGALAATYPNPHGFVPSGPAPSPSAGSGQQLPLPSTTVSNQSVERARPVRQGSRWLVGLAVVGATCVALAGALLLRSNAQAPSLAATNAPAALPPAPPLPVVTPVPSPAAPSVVVAPSATVAPAVVPAPSASAKLPVSSGTKLPGPLVTKTARPASSKPAGPSAETKPAKPANTASLGTNESLILR